MFRKLYMYPFGVVNVFVCCRKVILFHKWIGDNERGSWRCRVRCTPVSLHSCFKQVRALVDVPIPSEQASTVPSTFWRKPLDGRCL